MIYTSTKGGRTVLPSRRVEDGEPMNADADAQPV